ncbi:SH3 domain containing protein [Histomonas meleagridis]|uniref:SH3 domain containing protein n=1 Tax=Histomonas meleagridis TaxID=135588 RepID=UPI003559E210|nr:SH3 domain containing protein [Histomonas meleagridis]KAH0806597.1 SH3 domain containing protein [Histomonas meleagridis]
MAYAFGEFKLQNESNLIERISNNSSDDVAIGIPGTTLNGYLSVYKEFEEIQQKLNQMSNAIVNTFTTSVGAFASKRKDQLSETIEELFEVITKIEGVQQVMENFTSSHSEMIQRFAKYTNDIVLNPNNSGILKQYQLQFGKIVQARAKHEKTKVAMIRTAKASINKYRELVGKISDTFFQRQNTIKDLILWISTSFEEFSQTLEQSSKNLKTFAEFISFENDFQSFIESKHIVRYEMSTTDFVPLDTSGPAFEGVNTKLSVEISMLYPIGLANVIHDYQANGTNEMSCKKGKNILLLEEPTYPWVYVMNPRTRVTGYIPSECISWISRKFGVIIRDFNESNVIMQIGEYVAIIKELPNGSFLVENTFGIRTNADKSYIGLLYT